MTKPRIYNATPEELAAANDKRDGIQRRETCLRCKERFTPRKVNQKFCCPKHQQDYNRVKRGFVGAKCAQCERSLYPGNRYKKWFCSIECHDSYRRDLERRLGADNNPSIALLCKNIALETLEDILRGKAPTSSEGAAGARPERGCGAGVLNNGCPEQRPGPACDLE